jgi:GNAT superfamily N-acetyltransferase
VLRITEIDPFDDDAHDAYWCTYAAAERGARGPGATIWTHHETRMELRQRTTRVERRVFLARDGDDVLGTGTLALPHADNVRIAALTVHVPPQNGGRGVGSAILAQLERIARDASRTTLTSRTAWPYALGGAGAPDHGGLAFARRHGYRLGLTDLENRLTLPLPGRVADALRSRADARRTDFRLHSWVGPVPEQFAAGWEALDSSLDTEAPVGDMDRERTAASIERLRESEQLLRAQRRFSLGTVAVAGPEHRAAREVVAYTQLVVSEDRTAYQWGTLVRRDARGNGLGLAVKLANLELLAREAPDVTTVCTYNADVNEHMLAINDALGFRPAEYLGELQKKI